MDFRTAKAVILDSSEDVLRGVYGLSELLTPPSFEIPARVGRRKNPQRSSNSMDLDPSSSSAPADGKKGRTSSYVAGEELEAAEAAQEKLDIIWPFRGKDAWTDWRAIEAIWKHALEVMSPYRRKSNGSPVLFTHPSLFSADQSQLLTQTAFERLNLPAIALIPRSLASLYAVGSTTGICIDIGHETSSITPIVDTVIYSHTLVDVKLGTKHCEAYLAKLLAQDPKLTAILSSPPPPPPAVAPNDPSTSADPSAVAPPPPPSYPETPLSETLLRLAHQIFSLGLIRPNLMNGQRLTVEQEEEGVTDIAAALAAASRTAASKSHKSAARQAEDAKKKAKADTAAAGADVMLIEFEGREVSVGVVRHRFCEPLFDSTLMRDVEMDGKMGGQEDLPMLALQEAVELSVGSILSAHERLGVWDGIVVVGEAARMKTLPSSILSHLMPYILTDPESMNDTQPKNTRFLKIPKYFPEYVEEGGWTVPFLGASIAAKTIYNEATGRYFTTKFDYNSNGPAGVKSLE